MSQSMAASAASGALSPLQQNEHCPAQHGLPDGDAETADAAQGDEQEHDQQDDNGELDVQAFAWMLLLNRQGAKKPFFVLKPERPACKFAAANMIVFTLDGVFLASWRLGGSNCLAWRS